jgi:hypothetical protein
MWASCKPLEQCTSVVRGSDRVNIYSSDVTYCRDIRADKLKE